MMMVTGRRMGMMTPPQGFFLAHIQFSCETIINIWNLYNDNVDNDEHYKKKEKNLMK